MSDLEISGLPFTACGVAGGGEEGAAVRLQAPPTTIGELGVLGEWWRAEDSGGAVYKLTAHATACCLACYPPLGRRGERGRAAHY